MTQDEINIMNIEENLRDFIEKEILENKNYLNRTYIKDIKYIGNINNNENKLSENVFIVSLVSEEINKDGKIRLIEKEYCYLDDKRIGGTIGDNNIVFNNTFEKNNPEKIKFIKKAVSAISEEELENNSLNNLKKKEEKEILDVNLNNEKNNKKDLTKEQTDKIKVNGIQKVNLNKKVDGKETLGKRLDLEGFDSLYVVYSDNVKEISKDSKINNTKYSLVGMTNDGKAKVLNDEFEIDSTVGNNSLSEKTKIRANSTATVDNKDVSMYKRKSNGAKIGCENDQGHINMFFYNRNYKDNENVGIQIETSQTNIIPIETREVMNRMNGIYQKDKINREVKNNIDNGIEVKGVKDFDGDINTSEHINIIEAQENDFIPNCNMTYREFANKCGYRGEGSIEKVKKIICKMTVINQNTIDEYIEEVEEECMSHRKDKR